jgi:hypothetical protein
MMAYMASLSNEYMLECGGFPGPMGDKSFIYRENVYFLGKIEVSNSSAEYLGFPGYFKIYEAPFAIVSGFDASTNNLRLVSNGYNPPVFRNRGICKDDIVVGAKSGAVRYAARDWKVYTADGSSIEKSGIKEIGYNPTYHDLFDFSTHSDGAIFNRIFPLNRNFYNNTIFNNLDQKFSCVALFDRIPLPIPYSANKHGFRQAVAVTPMHVCFSEHVWPYMGYDLLFYDTIEKTIINRRIVKKFNFNLPSYILKNEDNDNIPFFQNDQGIGLLDSPLPPGVLLANVPDIAYKKYPDEATKTRKIPLVAIDLSGRGMCCNAISGFFKNDSFINILNIKSSQFIDALAYQNACLDTLGVGDSSTMFFTCIGNRLIYMGSIVTVSNTLHGLNGTFINQEIGYGKIDLSFFHYPDRNGTLSSSVENRYFQNQLYGTSLSFWAKVGNRALNYIFTSPDIWGEPIDPSYVPARIKITNDINITESNSYLNLSNDNLIDRKIKFIS